MGKRLRSQRRGKGSPTYRVPEYSFKPHITFHPQPGTITDIVHYPLTDAPLAKVSYADNTVSYIPAPEGARVGQQVPVRPLSAIPDGTTVFGLETQPGAGPKLCRSPGSSAVIISRTSSSCVIQLPSKKTRSFPLSCRAIIGIPAGEGRTDKPFLKAGSRWFQMHQRGKIYPRTAGVAMNAVSHPHGGSGSGTTKPPKSRNAPPGKKVGSFASRATGRQR